MRTCKILFFAVLSFFAMTMCSQAEVKDVSFRYGRGFDGKDFDQFDIAVSMALPWQRSLNSGWLTHFDVEGILGVLTLDGDTAVKPSVMSNVLVTSPAGKLDVIAGIGMGVMLGETKFSDDHDLGGPFFSRGR
ncbi:hypothetical protein [Desulfopila aestuarii]|uniref:Uncharacterized protein n=1 Tax=Desulfopila aestuarii DSM 18488 TaxID=1121416 RepID=A0A1M7YDZ1_9BACT|nr:hypothetical protein [Desulfopila aestuarii]SHO50864.1 hypothetical protein SAMN02745220_03676 [Desulfopila aestuarii DSM 18488]